MKNDFLIRGAILPLELAQGRIQSCPAGGGTAAEVPAPSPLPPPLPSTLPPLRSTANGKMLFFFIFQSKKVLLNLVLYYK